MSTKLISYALYENLFLLNETDVDCLINHKIKDYDPVESISYSSFLNMICQTTPIEDLLQLQICGKGRLFEKKDTVRLYLEPRIIYHRDNLLHYIIRIISQKVNGKNKITGENKGFDENVYNYGQILLLINNKLNYLKSQNFEREFIRFFPYHVPNTLFWFYKQRILRYSYIYENILNNIPNNRKNLLMKGIALIEQKYVIKFHDYLEAIKGIFIWFLGAKETGINSPQFNMNNIGTFYIDKNKFTGSKFIQIIASSSLSKDLKGFYEEFNKKKKDEIDNDLYKHFQNIFDYPIFKINNNQFCIIDLKFLIEGICSGLIWKIDSITRDSNNNCSMQETKGQYGYLIEEYFAFIMKKIFSSINLTYNQNGQPDAMLEVSVNGEDYIIIFEFTTKFYRISSLYNRDSVNFVEDLNRTLFSKTNNDKGKFINLNEYANSNSGKNKKAILILLTENWFGDYDLLNRIDNVLSNGIKQNRLNNLKQFKPIILSLDDLETFWAVTPKGQENECFINSILAWENEQKGRFWFSYANFVSHNKRLINQEYLEFFSAAKLGKKITEVPMDEKKGSGDS